MVSWWVSYLAKGPRLDFNNGPGENSNYSLILGPQHFFESDLNNGPSPSHSNLGADGSTSVQVSLSWSHGGRNIWPRAPGLISIMVQGITWIVAAFLPPPPSCLFESDSNNGPTRCQSNLGQMEDTSVQVSHHWSPVGCNIWPRAPA